MKSTKQFLNAVKAKTGAASDYALAKELDTSKQNISNYLGKDRPMSDDIALKVASILEIDPYIVLAAVHAEHAKTEAEKSAWNTLFERLGGVAASVVIATTLFGHSAPVKASEQVVSHKNVYYVKSRKRKKPPFNPLKVMIEQLLMIA